MYCPKCGKLLPNDANFCSNCGQAVKTTFGPQPFPGIPQPFSGSIKPFPGIPQPFSGPIKPFPGMPKPLHDDYEYCTITLNAGVFHLSWEAMANNRQVAKVEFTVNPFGNMDHLRRVKNIEMVSQLMSQGWEALTHDSQGCVVSMRRKK